LTNVAGDINYSEIPPLILRVNTILGNIWSYFYHRL